MSTRPATYKFRITLGLTLLFGALALLIPVILSLFTEDFGWIVTTWFAYTAVALATFIGSWRLELNPLFGPLIGYLFGWINMILINGQMSLSIYQRSRGAFLILFFIAPLSYALVGLTAAGIGWLTRKYSQRRLKVPENM